MTARVGGALVALCVWLIPPAAAFAGDPSGPTPTVQRVVFLSPSRPLLVDLLISIDGRLFREHWRARIVALARQLLAEDQDGLSLERAGLLCDVLNAKLPTVGQRQRDRWNQLRTGLDESQPTISPDDFADRFVNAVSQFRMAHGAVAGEAGGPALFPMVDQDGDGRLSTTELRQSARHIPRWDFSDDGLLTVAELQLLPAPDQLAERDSLPSSLVMAIDSNYSDREIADALLEHYGDGDRLLELDPDSDRELTQADLLDWMTRDADLTLDLPLGNTVRRTRGRRSQGDSAVRSRRTIQGGFRINTPDLEIAFRRNNRQQEEDEDMALELTEFDTDKNGYLDKDEWSASNIRLPMSLVDRNNDEMVRAAELEQAASLLRGLSQLSPLLLGVFDRGQDLFSLIDDNLDGLITKRELNEAHAGLGAVDMDGDGHLEPSEIPRRWTLELARANNVSELIAARPPRRVDIASATDERAGPNWFQRMDRNGDGDVDEGEFLGTAGQFRGFDTDEDQLISGVEASATVEQTAE